MSMLGLEGKRVLVTGASRGIGFGIAEAFATAKVELHMLADDTAIKNSAAMLQATGHQVDITDSKAVTEAMEAIGPLDVLINNAGLERLTPLDDPSFENESVFRRILEINITGTFLVTRAALPHMSAGGRIVNTASIWGRVGEPLFGAYVASKHAIIGLTKSWAKELGPRGINVNSVCPGWVRTDAAMRSLAGMAAREGRSEDELLAGIVGAQALPGLMEPADIAGVYLFLSSALAANVTGQSLGADRGEVPW